MESPAQSSFTATESWTLVATVLGSTMVFIDGTALNVALPALQRNLGVTGTELLWIINAYTLFLSALILVGGALGDIYGRNRIFSYGLILFSLASAAAGFSQSSEQLILARAFQGLGGAMLTPGSLSIITSQIAPERRGRGIGIWSTFSALTAVVGPVLGGWLASQGLWRFIFFINIPLAVIVLWVIFRKVPESRDEHAYQLDILGGALATLGLAGITYGFIESPNYGFYSPRILLALGLGLLFLVLFYVSQKRQKHPMLPLGLFKSPTFTAANFLTLLLYAALGGITFFMPLNLVQVQGYTESQAGIALLPTILLISFVSPLSGRFADRFGVRIPLIVGPIVAGLGFLLFIFPGETAGFSTDYWKTYLPAFVVMGLGMGITVAPLTTAVMGAIPQESTGIASGVNNAVSRTAGVLAVSVLGAVMLLSFKNSLEDSKVAQQLNEQERTELLQAAEDLGATQPPEELSKSETAAVKGEVKSAFLSAFKEVTIATAIMAWLSALVAFFFIQPVKPEEDLDPFI